MCTDSDEDDPPPREVRLATELGDMEVMTRDHLVKLGKAVCSSVFFLEGWRVIAVARQECADPIHTAGPTGKPTATNGASGQACITLRSSLQSP